MESTSELTPAERKAKLIKGVTKRLLTILIYMVITGAILFLTSGNIRWVWAWVYLGICLVSVTINGVITLRKSPETIAERGEAKLTQTWDKILAGFYSLAMNLALPIIAGLDVRFGWTRELGTGWHVVGAVMFAAGLELTAWAMIANAFFSVAVRIQNERGHTVCTTGPYRFVRHPGYVGFIIQTIFVAILFGSLWAWIPGLVGIICLVLRTAFEDRTLKTDLAGYKEYAQKVRYRLLPGIW